MINFNSLQYVILGCSYNVTSTFDSLPQNFVASLASSFGLRISCAALTSSHGHESTDKSIHRREHFAQFVICANQGQNFGKKMNWAIWKERRFTETLQARQFISSMDVELGIDYFLPACFFTAVNGIYFKRVIQM